MTVDNAAEVAIVFAQSRVEEPSTASIDREIADAFDAIGKPKQ